MANTLDGILLIDKPEGPTSHDVIYKLRRHLGLRQIGHAGTLDPLATGLLVCLLGRATKLSPYLTGHRKRYHLRIVLGSASNTYDREGEIIPANPPDVTQEALEAAVRAFPRRYDQTPPPFSAKKIAGKPAYKLARKGDEVELKSVAVDIYELTVTGFDYPRADLVCEVSAGTYIRSLAVDLARQLGTVAYLERLQRLTSGPFRLDDAVRLDDLLRMPPQAAAECVLDVSAGVKDFPRVDLDEPAHRQFIEGQRVTIEAQEGFTAVFGGNRFVGFGEIENGRLRPRRVLYR